MADRRTPALGFIFVTLMLDILGIGLIIPILPKLVGQLRGGTLTEAAHSFAWLGALYALMQFLFAPVLGNLSDRFGRRPVILVSLLGSGLDYLLLAFAPTLGWFYVGRIVSGIMGANITAATAYIADISPPEKRAANFGIIGAAFGVGFIAGPALGGMLGNQDLRLPFLVASGLTLLNALYGFFVLPESLALENRRPFSWARANPVGSFVALNNRPLVLGLAVSLFLTNLAQFSLHSTWVLYTGHRYQWTPNEVGWSLAVVGLTAGIVQGGLARKIIPALGEARSVTLGLLLGAVAMAGYGLATRGGVIYAILVVGSISGIAGPALQGLVSRSVGADEQGAVQGALTALSSVAGFVAPLMGGWTFGYFVSPQAPVYLPGASFFVAALVMIGAWQVAAVALRRHPPSPHTSTAAPSTPPAH
jgi:MFS transporter, DHA1 family, tetracycline resistance protein